MYTHTFGTTVHGGNGYQHVVHNSHEEYGKSQETIDVQTGTCIFAIPLNIYQWLCIINMNLFRIGLVGPVLFHGLTYFAVQGFAVNTVLFTDNGQINVVSCPIAAAKVRFLTTSDGYYQVKMELGIFRNILIDTPDGNNKFLF